MSINLLIRKKEKFEIFSEVNEEKLNYPLAVKGDIPSWLSGTLIRNGAVNVKVNGQKNAHLFDGLAMLHAFSFNRGAVNYTNKFLRSKAYDTVFKEGSLNYGKFSADPCRSLFKSFFTLFLKPTKPDLHNASVNVAKLAEQYVAMTESPLPVKFDPETLDTLGVFDYQDELPKDKCWESAHPHYDQQLKTTVNYLIKFGRTCYYTLYNIEDGSSKRHVLAEIPVKEPSYMHSFALTENYVIFTEFPFVVKPLDLMTKGKAFIKNFSWQPERGTQFLVINRHNGNLVGRYVTKPFFAFHHANAFEDGDNLHLDIVCFKDATIISSDALMNYENKNFFEDYNCPSTLERFSLSLTSKNISSETLFRQSNEFPRVNDHFDGRPYRYVHLVGVCESTSNSNALYKVDTTTKKTLEWSEEGCFSGEPVFVAAPDAKEEDEGVVLAVVSDQLHHNSFLLVLDGKSYKEIGRAEAPHVIPFGFHGQYFQLPK